MFGSGKAKVKIKTAKGGGPIRKLKFAIGAGVIVSILKGLFGDAIPADLLNPIARFLLESGDLLTALVAFYVARPAMDDGATDAGA